MPEGLTCPQCGVLNPIESNFCSACGTGLPEPAATEEATGRYPELDVGVIEAGEVGQLVVTRGPTAGARYALGNGTTSIGRHPDSEVFLDDVTVSRHHARVLCEGNAAFRIEDAGSLNGTYVDGERVESETLREGAQIQVGKFRLVFVIGALGQDG